MVMPPTRSTAPSLGTSFKNRLLSVNLFQSGVEDQLVIENERRATRLYVLLFIISVFIVGFYYTFVSYTHTYMFKSPTFLDYSKLPKELDLQCPCTRIAIRYDEFLRVEPSFHPLCQNNFLSDEIIKHLYLLYERTTNRSIPTDVHRIAVFQVQTLQRLCQLTETTLSKNLRIFLQTNLIQTQLVSSNDLQKQMAFITDDYLESTSKSFIRTLNFVQDITAQSFFMTGASITSVLPVNQYLLLNGNLHYDGMQYTFTNGSSCICSSSSANSCLGLATLRGVDIPGFYTGCYMLTALLHSTLDVFVNQTLFNTVTQTTNKFLALNSSSSSVITIQFLLRQMFAINWSKETSFEDYFKQCAPISCQYTMVQRHDLLFILTTLIGLFGGLSSALRIIASVVMMTLWPVVWKKIQQRKTRGAQIMQISVRKSDRIRQLFKSIRQYCVQLNLFPSIPPSQDATILRRQRYTTRLYVVLLIAITAILAIFTSTKSQTTHITVDSPSADDFTHLYLTHSRTLRCPCSQTTFDQQLISHVEPIYHPVCSSPFVSSDWINVKFLKSNGMRLTTNDIRYQTEVHFQLLATLCHRASQTVEDTLQLFYQTKFISKDLLHPQSFQTQMDLAIDLFKRTVPESFRRVVQVLKTNNDINQFITPMNSLFLPAPVSKEDETILLNPFQHIRYGKQECLQPDAYSNVSCMCFPQASYPCYHYTNIRETNDNYTIPGMFQTWFPLQALLMSTLECFYDETCFTHITDYIDLSRSLVNFTILNDSLLSPDEHRDDSIEVLVNKLFIQSWKNDSSFQAYFNQCQPLTCHYSYRSQVSLIFILTAIIGTVGGINVVLHLFSPVIINLRMILQNYIIDRRQNVSLVSRLTQSRRLRVYRRLQHLFMDAKQRFLLLNLFITIPITDNPEILRRNRRATRVYLILVVTAFALLILYTLLEQETVTNTIESPSLSTYRQLFRLHSATLQCPCTNPIIKHSKFLLQFEPEYHEICSSVFVSSQWFGSLGRATVPGYEAMDLDKIMHFLRRQFEALPTLCGISQFMLNTSLSAFRQSDYISAYALSEIEFVSRIHLLIEQFRIKLISQYTETFKLIQISNHANQLSTAYYSNWIFTAKYIKRKIEFFTDQLIPLLTRPRTFGDANECSCGMQWNCSKLSRVEFSVRNDSLYEFIPDLYVGCLSFDALLQSSLTCLYNKTCVSLIQAAFQEGKPIKADVLLPSSFMPNTTFETLLYQFFVSRWIENISFDSYYEECAPEMCQYSHIVEHNVGYTITMLIAAFGGLTNGLHFLVKCLMAIVYKIVDYKRRRTNLVRPDKNSVSTLEPSLESRVNSEVEQQPSETMRRDRPFFVGLICFITIVIIASSTIFVIRRKNNDNAIPHAVYSTITSTEFASNQITSKIPNHCYVTLKNQSQVYLNGLNLTSFVAGDFNRDSFIDIIVVNAESDTLTIMSGNGTGTYEAKESLHTGNRSRPQEILAADFNHDTLLDIVVVLSGTKQIVVYFGRASETSFVTPPKILPDLPDNAAALAVALGDIDRDGWIDLSVISGDYDGLYDRDITAFLNVDGYRVVETRTKTTWLDDVYMPLIIGNFKNGRKQANSAWRTAFGHIYFYTFQRFTADGNYFIYFTDIITTDFGHSSKMIKGKFNYDESDDLAYVFPETNILSVVISNPNNDTQKMFTQTAYLTSVHPISLAIINFNYDSIDDLAILHCDGSVTVFVGSDIGLFDRDYLSFGTTTTTAYGTDEACAQSLQVVDLNRDKRDDLIFIGPERNSIQIMLTSPCDL